MLIGQKGQLGPGTTRMYMYNAGEGQLGIVPSCLGQKGQLGPGTTRMYMYDAGEGQLGIVPQLSGTEGTTRTWDSMYVCCW